MNKKADFAVIYLVVNRDALDQDVSNPTGAGFVNSTYVLRYA